MATINYGLDWSSVDPSATFLLLINQKGNAVYRIRLSHCRVMERGKSVSIQPPPLVAEETFELKEAQLFCARGPICTISVNPSPMRVLAGTTLELTNVNVSIS